MVTLEEYKTQIQRLVYQAYQAIINEQAGNEIYWAETGAVELARQNNVAEFTILSMRPSRRQGQDYSDTRLELTIRSHAKDRDTRAALLYSLLNRYSGRRFPIVMHNTGTDPNYLYTTYVYQWQPEIENSYDYQVPILQLPDPATSGTIRLLGKDQSIDKDGNQIPTPDHA